MSIAKSPNLGIVIAGLLLGILMASMDSTIVATALVPIAFAIMYDAGSCNLIDVRTRAGW